MIEKILWICCFSKAVSTQLLLEVRLVMETLSRVQEGKTSLTSLWSNIAADQLEPGNGKLKQPKMDYPRLHPKLLKGEKQPLSRPLISIHPRSSSLPAGAAPFRSCFLTAKEEGSAQHSMWSRAPVLCVSRCFRSGNEQGCL